MQPAPPPIPGAPPPEAFPAQPGMPGAPPAGAVDLSQKMLIVDVVIVSSEEDINTAKGVNLLSQLQLTFGTSSLPAYSAVFMAGVGATHTITRAISIPAVTYSLNIANSGTNRSEILARPSLVATSGIKSEFFSGSNIRAAAVAATSTGAPTGSIDVDKDIGVKLGVTPQFIDNGKVRLQVQAERTFLQNTTTSVQFQFQINTTKTTVNANVVMNLGETLILSGLSEKETDNVRNGVPGLEDIPGLQYFFSRQTTRDFNKSVLILLTPRSSEYVFRPRDVRERAQATMSPDERVLSELQSRYTDWFRPYPNWASVFHHLQENQLYREFRTGDVTLERWETQTSLKVRLSKLSDFVYY
jgi:type II secretory pathway component GspD/PulD (secretin)